MKVPADISFETIRRLLVATIERGRLLSITLLNGIFRCAPSTLFRRGFLISTALCGAALGADPARAANFTITNTNDSGAGSLRQAIIDSNATPGSNTIVLQAGLIGNIALASPLPAIVVPVSINLKNSALDGIAIGGNFGLSVATTGAVTLSNVTGVYLGNTTVTSGTVNFGGLVSGDPLVAPRSLLVTNPGTTVNIAAGGASVANLSGAGTIVNHANPSTSFTLFGGDSAPRTFAGTISGSGNFVMFGGGQNLTLSGATTYTGGTFLLGASGGPSFTLMLQTGAANVLSPNSRFTLNGDTTLKLNGFNQTIASLDSFTSFAFLPGALPTIDLGAGTLTIGGDNQNGTYFGSIIGTGGLTKTGSGTLTLQTSGSGFSSTINYSGATLVSAGVLQAANANAFSANSAHTVNGAATLDLNNFNQAIGSLAGAGNVTLGAGTLTTGADNASTTLSGTIGGSGSMTKVGTGVFRLTGTNLYTGATTINAGTLVVDGSIATSALTTVSSGGILAGSGTVGSTTVNAGGTIAPGNSIGTLNVTGNVTFAPGSIYEVEANAAGQADKILATGTAMIQGGTVKVLASAGNYAPATTYTILTATGGRNGNFAGATSNFAFLTPVLTYDPSNVYLTLNRNSTDFATIGGTRNQRAAGGGVESLGWGHPIYAAVLQLDAPTARRAFDAVSGEIYASAKTALIEDSRFVRDAATDRIRSAFADVAASSLPVMAYGPGGPQAVAPTGDRLAVWGKGFGSWGHTSSDGNAARLERSTGGFLIGADTPVFETWRLGLIAGYSRTSFNVRDRQSSGSSDNYHLGLYGGTQWGALGLRTGLTYTWHDISTSRSAIFPGFADSLKGKYDAGTFQAFGDLGYRIDTPVASFEPFANLAYVNLNNGGFAEQGGVAGLRANGQTMDTTFTTLGLRASTGFALADINLTARGSLGWRHAFGDTTPLSMQAFSAGNPFTVAGVPIARDAAIIETGLDLNLTPAATLGISYSGQFAPSASDQSVRANLSVRF